MSVIGIDLGGTKLATAIFDSTGSIQHKSVNPLEKRKGKEVGELINSSIQTCLRFAEKNNISIDSIGICIPGISYSRTGTVWAPNISGWENYPLLEEIKSVVNGSIKVKIDSDRACYILGEVWKGSAQNCKDAIFLAVGTGIGAGILVDGKILRGSNDIAGAIGWLALDKPFYQKYISCGCFEYHASGDGLVKVAKEFLKNENDYNGILKNKEDNLLNAKDIFDAYDKNDKIAVKVITEAIEFWGMAVANLISLFNPEKIIFGGGVFGPGIRFLDSIKDEAQKWAQPIAVKQESLEASKLGGDAGLYGAGYLALMNQGSKDQI